MNLTLDLTLGAAGLTSSRKAKADEDGLMVQTDSNNHRQAPRLDALERNQVQFRPDTLLGAKYSSTSQNLLFHCLTLHLPRR